MTEENRGPAKASSEDDDLVPGFGSERQHPAGPKETAAPPETVADQEIPEPEAAPGRDTPADDASGQDVLGADAPDQDAPEHEPGAGQEAAGQGALGREPGGEPGQEPPGEGSEFGGDRLVAGAGGFAPPDGPSRDDPPQDSPPQGVQQPGMPPPGVGQHGMGQHGMGQHGMGQHGMAPQEVPVQAPVGLEKYAPEGPDRHRPGFVPHSQDPRAQQGTPYGWPPQHSQQPPPPGGRPMGPPPMGGGPMGPPGAPRPMGAPGGYGPPPGGPNWAPVPAMPSAARVGPGLGVLAVVALIVALVAGGVGAGVGVMAAGGDDGGNVSLGGSDSGAGPAVKNRPPDSVAGVAQKVLPSVVMIKVQSPGGEGTGGTGFIVNGGYVVTNNHVAAGAGAGGKIEIVFNDKKTLPAVVKGRDPSSDVAVLKPQGDHSLPALAVGDSNALAVGDPVIAIGSPLGLQGSVTTGIISSLNRAVPTQGEGGGDATYLNAIQTDAAINPGNSGGPLVDGKGRVIGINTAIATLGGQSLGGQNQSGSIGLGFAIPINQGKRVAEEIIRTGSAKRAQLGIGMDQRFPGPGVKIAERPMEGVVPIVKGGAAEKAGLKPGDVITKLGDHPIEDASDLAAQIRSMAPGEKIKITYQRGGKETTVEATLGAG